MSIHYSLLITALAALCNMWTMPTLSLMMCWHCLVSATLGPIITIVVKGTSSLPAVHTVISHIQRRATTERFKRAGVSLTICSSELVKDASSGPSLVRSSVHSNIPIPLSRPAPSSTVYQDSSGMSTSFKCRPPFGWCFSQPTNQTVSIFSYPSSYLLNADLAWCVCISK